MSVSGTNHLVVRYVTTQMVVTDVHAMMGMNQAVMAKDAMVNILR